MSASLAHPLVWSSRWPELACLSRSHGRWYGAPMAAADSRGCRPELTWPPVGVRVNSRGREKSRLRSHGRWQGARAVAAVMSASAAWSRLAHFLHLSGVVLRPPVTPFNLKTDCPVAVQKTKCCSVLSKIYCIFQIDSGIKDLEYTPIY
jgi:hypothetical protein